MALPPKKACQTCTTCGHINKCWATHTNLGKPISKNNVLINILVCRLQLGVKRDEAAKNLIAMYKPGMMRLIQNARQMSNDADFNVEQLFNDMSSTMIEYLMRDYKIGDRGRATPYLFDPQQGFLTKWIKWILNKNRKFYIHHELVDDSNDESDGEGHIDDGDDVAPRTATDSTGLGHQESHMAAPDEQSDFTRQLMAIIEDGVTLNSNEYRVLKFCLYNGNELNATRHIDGLHIMLANIMGVSRPRVTRLYKRAREKVKASYAAQAKDDE